MSHSELDALRAVFAARPKPKDIAEMRQNIDARGLAYGVSSDVTVEVTDAGGVKAEWTRTANADPHRAILTRCSTSVSRMEKRRAIASSCGPIDLPMHGCGAELQMSQCSCVRERNVFSSAQQLNQRKGARVVWTSRNHRETI